MPDRATEPQAGLMSATARVPVPLEGVSVEARLRDFASRVTVAQRFRNSEARPIEAVYVFPLEEGAAVCSFEAVIGETHVVGTDARSACVMTHDFNGRHRSLPQ